MIDLIGKTLGAYQVLLKVHSDGLTTIYKAHDSQLGRNVALQIISSEIAQSPAFQQKVKELARMLAKLTHSNIARLLACDTYENELCLVYDFEPREVLRAKFHQKMTWFQASKILIPVSQALESAHAQGVIHGHLTPASIMLSTAGIPYLYDFGLYLLLQQEILDSTPGNWLGLDTNSLQSPEQVLGKQLDARTDIYSFGAIFYGMLTDGRPFSGVTPIEEVFQQFEAPLQLPPSLKKDLNPFQLMILQRMLEKDPDARFQEMSHVATLLTRIALKLPMSKKAVIDKNWVDRKKGINRTFVVIGSLCVLMILFAGGFLATKNTWRNPAPVISPSSTVGQTLPLPTAGATLKPTRTAAPTSSAPVVQPTSVVRAAPPSLPVLENTAVPISRQSIESDRVSRMVTLGLLGLGKFTDLDWSPQGKQIALSSSNGIHFLDHETFDVEKKLDMSAWITSVEYSPDGNLVAAGDQDGLVRLWSSVEKKTVITLSGCTGQVTNLEFSGDGKYLAALVDQNRACVWLLPEGQIVRAEVDFPMGVLASGFTPDLLYFVTASSDDVVRWWSLEDWSIFAIRESPARLVDLTISPDSKRIIAVDRSAHLWEWVLNDEVTRDLGRPLSTGTYHVEISPNGAYLAASDIYGTVKVMDPQGTVIWFAEATDGLIRTLDKTIIPHFTFSPDSKYLISASWGGNLRVWMVDTGLEVTVERDYFTAYEKLATNKKYLAAQTSNGTVKVWSLIPQQLVFSVPGYLVDGLPFSSDGRLLAIKTASSDVQILNMDDGSVVTTLTAGNIIKSIVFSSAENLIMAGSKEDVHVWSTVNWQEIKLKLSYSRLGCKDIGEPNDDKIGMISLNNNMQFIESADVDLCSEGITGWMKFFTWNLRSKLAAAGGPGKLEIWKYPSSPTDDPTEIQGTRGIDYSTGKFLNDGTLLFVAANDFTVMAYSSHDGEKLATFYGHSDMITDLIITNDDLLLITSSLDGTIRIWGIQ